MNAIENGKHNPSLPLVFKMIHLLGVPLEGIFEPEEDTERRDR